MKARYLIPVLLGMIVITSDPNLRAASNELAASQIERLDRAEVTQRFRGCDYFIADGPNGLYVLEWSGGYDPSVGDSVEGEINSYGFKDVLYNNRSEGRVWVEDYWESRSAAMDEINDHCG